jgi:glycolate oxidase FAD binding subunit
MPNSSTALDAHWQKLISSATNVPSLPTITPTLEELPEVMRGGDRLLIAGNGSKIGWGNPVQQPSLLVKTTKLNKLIDHAVGDLTVTVEAGISFAALQTQLATANQFLPLDPLFPDQATIGGIIATADTGSLRQRYGGVRDLLLGISWIRADGASAKAGGRVVKNVAGYDTMKLFTGAYGTLGILQQVSLRVYPIPVASGSVWITGDQSALNSLIGKLGAMTLTPTALDLITPQLAQKLKVSGQMGILARFQTIPTSITVQSDTLIAMAQSLGLQAQKYEGDAETQIWQQLRPLVMAAPIVVKIGLQATAAVDFLAAIPEEIGVIHIGSGIGLLGLAESTRSTEILALRQQCAAAKGYLSVLTAPNQIKQQLEVWGFPDSTIKLMQQLHHQFDPQSIFNPGKFF